MLPIGDGPLLASPSFVTSWPDNPGILVVAERATALVTAWNVTDGVGPITVVDLSSEAFLPGSNGDQIGVTGVAFHPHFNRNPDRRFVYVRYNAALANSTVQTRVKRWKIPPGTLTVIPSTGVQMYKWDTTSTQHGSGTIHFDTREVADPVLYVPMPDDASPGNCTPAGLVQDTQGPSDLGKLLSVDVNQTLPVVTKLSTDLRILSMGQDAAGEIYLARVDASLPIAVNGEVFKVTQ